MVLKIKLQGKFMFPAWHAWKRLLSDAYIENLQDQKDIQDVDWKSFIRRHFNVDESSDNSHRKVRQNYSLPMLAKTSGGFRVNRDTPTGKVFQLVEVESGSKLGYPVDSESNTINFSANRFLPTFETTRVTPVDNAYKLAEGHETVTPDDWLEVEVPEVDKHKIIKLYMAPQERFRIKLQVSWAVFKDQILPGCKEVGSISSAANLPASLKPLKKKDVDANDALDSYFFTNGVLSCHFLSEPRGNLDLLRIGSVIEFSYIVESSNKSMKEMYQAAFSRIHEASDST